MILFNITLLFNLPYLIRARRTDSVVKYFSFLYFSCNYRECLLRVKLFFVAWLLMGRARENTRVRKKRKEKKKKNARRDKRCKRFKSDGQRVSKRYYRALRRVFKPVTICVNRFFTQITYVIIENTIRRYARRVSRRLGNFIGNETLITDFGRLLRTYAKTYPKYVIIIHVNIEIIPLKVEKIY